MTLTLIPARRYYGRHATGWVVLADGDPTHFTGRGAKQRAENWVEMTRGVLNGTKSIRDLLESYK